MKNNIDKIYNVDNKNSNEMMLTLYEIYISVLEKIDESRQNVHKIFAAINAFGFAFIGTLLTKIVSINLVIKIYTPLLFLIISLSYYFFLDYYEKLYTKNTCIKNRIEENLNQESIKCLDKRSYSKLMGTFNSANKTIPIAFCSLYAIFYFYFIFL